MYFILNTKPEMNPNLEWTLVNVCAELLAKIGPTHSAL